MGFFLLKFLSTVKNSCVLSSFSNCFFLSCPMKGTYLSQLFDFCFFLFLLFCTASRSFSPSVIFFSPSARKRFSGFWMLCVSHILSSTELVISSPFCFSQSAKISSPCF